MTINNTKIDEQLDEITQAGSVAEALFRRQPNTLLQTQDIWRQRSLWDIEDFTTITERDTTHLFDLYLLEAVCILWQDKPKDNEGFIWAKFADIGKVIYKTDRLNPDQYKSIKDGLLRVGGNQLPIGRVNSSGKYSIRLTQLIEVEFETNLRKEDFEKIDNMYKMGNTLLSLLKEGEAKKHNQKITRVGIRPNSTFIKEIQEGKGQGYTSIRLDAIPQLRPVLTEAGKKWFNYISQLRLDGGQIKLDTVIRRFGWQEKLKNKGKPECLRLALEGFRQCIDNNQIYPPQTIQGKREGSYYLEAEEKFVFLRTREWVRKKEPLIKTVKSDDYYLEKLKKIIKKNSWTITSVAEKLGANREHLSKILSGKKKCGSEIIDKIRTLTG